MHPQYDYMFSLAYFHRVLSAGLLLLHRLSYRELG